MSAQQLATVTTTMDHVRLDLAVARRFATQTRKTVAGIRAVELALGALRRRVEAGEDVTEQLQAIAGLVRRLEETARGAR